MPKYYFARRTATLLFIINSLFIQLTKVMIFTQKCTFLSRILPAFELNSIICLLFSIPHTKVW